MKPIEALQRMRQWRQNDTPPGPESIKAFITNRCNLNCRHCWRHWVEWDRTSKTELSDERWLRLVDESAALNTRNWVFLGGGEPLVRRDLILAMIEKISSYDMNCWIHTNGTLFTPEFIETSIDKNIHLVVFSIDGPDAATNNAIRGSGFEKAIENLRYFADCKNKNGQDLPALHLYATITNLTYDKLDRFAELAASIDNSIYVQLSSLLVDSEETSRLALSEEQFKALPEMVDKGMQRAMELGIKTNFADYRNAELMKDSANSKHVHSSVRHGDLSDAMCYEPWLSAAIMSNGYLGPCCAFYGEDVLSIKDASLQDVWTGAYMNQVREKMFNGSPPNYCVRCPSNLFIGKEVIRAYLADYLHRDQMSLPQRLAGVAQRFGNTYREKGAAGILQRINEWRRYHFEESTK
jgi:MoaA/NifB/PqqE/SkfB family radical SAM enzyme